MTIAWKHLATPFDAEAPSGPDMTFSTEFDAIRDARRADDPTLAQGEWVAALKTADWREVRRRCEMLLRDTSKDIRVAGWLAEAWTNTDGFAGLAAGYALVRELCEHQWDTVHPRIENGDIEERAGAIRWLLTNALTWTRLVPLVKAPQGQYGLAVLESARERRDGAAGTTLEAFEAARRATPREFFLALAQDVDQCMQAMEALEAVIDVRLGVDGPSFRALREQYESIQHFIARHTRDTVTPTDEVEISPTELPPIAPAEPVAGDPRKNGSPVATRREAIEQLRTIAEYFRRTEPHSPVAYLVDKAAAWGEMPLHQWLKRVVKDDSTLHSLLDLLDVDQPSASS